MASTSSSSNSNDCVTSRFLQAAFNGDLKLVKQLVLELTNGESYGRRTDIVANVKDTSGGTALHHASMSGKTHVCKYLIEELNLDINSKDDDGRVPLLLATIASNLLTIIYLLEKGADPNVTDENELTALHFAAVKGHKKLLHLLISNGAVVDVDAADGLGTPLIWATLNEKKDAMKILLDHNANPNKIFRRVYTALLVAINMGSLGGVEVLLEAGADPNLGQHEMTPLAAAVSKEQKEIVKYLLKSGASPDVVDMLGRTAVETAAWHLNKELMMILFPVTSRLENIADWSISGIIKYVHSKEYREEMKIKKKGFCLFLKSNGDGCFKRKEYVSAIHWYTLALNVDPDPILLSNRSMCWAKINDGVQALCDAQGCVLLKPDWPKAYYRLGVAWNIMKEYGRAAAAFRHGWKLDRNNKDLEAAFWEATQKEMMPMSLDNEG